MRKINCGVGQVCGNCCLPSLYLTGVQIGLRPSVRFDGTFFNVMEEEGSLQIPVGVIEGALGTEVEVLVTTINETAQGTYKTYIILIKRMIDIVCRRS